MAADRRRNAAAAPRRGSCVQASGWLMALPALRDQHGHDTRHEQVRRSLGLMHSKLIIWSGPNLLTNWRHNVYGLANRNPFDLDRTRVSSSSISCSRFSVTRAIWTLAFFQFRAERRRLLQRGAESADLLVPIDDLDRA